ncbi:MAG: tetraacyldisaccharide 4'-kinase [Nitrospirota bacterium]|nr:tetraacyldisaccharide 4'-kinase [Nitrospirota bacterium]MDP3598762.1 tetraacyldisaccharide 4'-kinase [Nitrospirota bacterium]
MWAAIPYGAVARLRALLYYWGWFAQRRLPVPVVSVGNLTLGGTGKTPVVIQLVEWLLAQGSRVAILSRGYRRTSTDPYLLVSNGEQLLVGPNEAGDEPFLMAQRCPRAIVAVGADRYELGRWVLDRFPVDCLILDDGFQHLGIYRDVNLLLVDATDAAGLAALVPAGRLREPLQAAGRATAIVITRADAQARVTEVCRRLQDVIDPMPDPIQVVFRPERLWSVVSGASQPLSWSKGKTALLCSAVGHAGSFRALVESVGITVLDEVVFIDHHAYTRQDVEQLRARATELQAELVVTTEKDACKLAVLLQPTDPWWAVRLATDVTVGEDQLRQAVLGKLKVEG